jgi:hypothetical protein
VRRTESHPQSLCGVMKLTQVFSFTNPRNLIDSIWDYYVDFTLSSGSSILDDSITDLGQCRSMTEFALENGCLAGESVPFNAKFPTPLFHLCGSRQLEPTRCQFADALKQLLWAGYDKELQNDTGMTPLLFAAFSHQFRSLTVMELLLTEDTNIHAVDNQRRGALHLCVWFFPGLQESCTSVCKGSILANDNPFVAEHLMTLDAFGDSSFDLQENDNDMEEVLPCDNGGGHIDEESDVDYAEYDSEDPSDDTDDSPGSQGCYWCGEGNCIQIDDMSDDEFAMYHYCADRDVDNFNMPETPDPEPRPWLCKARLRFKLLALLKAGCCPNALDGEGLSPSDYAKAEGVWPQWEWALLKSDFQYIQFPGSWERGS